MLHFIALLSLAQGSLAAKISSRWDTQNGYWDYVTAAQVVETPEFDAYQAWFAYVVNPRNGADVAPPRPDAIRPDDSSLDVQSRMANLFGQALEGIKLGNRKAVWEPRNKVDSGTEFPEYAGFKAVGKLEMSAAEVDFANGRSETAVAELIDGMKFANRIGVGPIISRLVGIAVQSIMMAELDRHLPQLSLPDARTLRAYAEEELNRQTPNTDVFRFEAGSVGEAVADLRNEWKTQSGPKTPAYQTQVVNLSDSQVAELQQEVSQRATGAIQQAARIWSGSPDTWLNAIDQFPDLDDGTLAGKVADYAYGKSFVKPLVQAQARSRIQLELLRLHAKAIEYRWLNYKLPDKIEDFTTEAERTDPVTHAHFSYKREGIWYRLTCPGFGNIKDIGLKSTVSPPIEKLPGRP